MVVFVVVDEFCFGVCDFFGFFVDDVVGDFYWCEFFVEDVVLLVCGGVLLVL